MTIAPAVRVAHQGGDEELRRALEQGIDLAQVGAVAAIVPTVPQLLQQPDAAHRPQAPLGSIDRAGLAPQVGVVVHHPTGRVVERLCGVRAGLGQIEQHGFQRLHALVQCVGFAGPVVHLGVDVDGVLAFPRRLHQVVPDALQIGRLGAWP